MNCAVRVPTNRERRLFLGMAAAAGALGQAGVLSAAARKVTASRLPSMPWNALQRIDAGDLNVSFVDIGPRTGAPIILLHGWPYDIHAFAESVPLLTAAGYRVIIPELRGYGATLFRSADTPRNAQQAALAVDIIVLMDALNIPQAVVAGFDWGARTANIVAALWPERCRAMVSVSGYLIGSQKATEAPLAPETELLWWYQYYFATERGRLGYERNRREFAKLIWRIASPKWNFDDAVFARSAAAFENPDHVAITIHNYRWRLNIDKGETRFDDIEARLAAMPNIAVPSVTLEGDANGAPHPKPVSYAGKFSGRYVHRLIKGGVGHNLPQEAPKEFADAILEAISLSS